MKQVLTYVIGTLVLMPCCMVFTDNLLVNIIAIAYTFAVYKSPSYSPKVKRFWRNWHKQNLKLTSIIKK